ncbi:hypothetical protein TIFTF001_006881 [Ficus carica]|uniref:DUF7798 domain-containing protein n=1 Tax=Ficus carica TaxID=3494 RepID=A0AA88AC76_FICCA|nr:hypothetical protein TIFTF001_006881 [Ficus carica]
MEEENQPLKGEKKAPQEGGEVAGGEVGAKESAAAAQKSSGGGGWGGWGFSSFSVLSDLQKAAEEISRNAAAAAQTAAKSIADLQNTAEESEESSKEDEAAEESAAESEKENEESEEESSRLRKSALDKLEKAGEDSIFSQARAWQAFGSAWKGGTELVHKIEHSAANLAESIQHSGPVAPSILETGKAFTSKGIQVLELVGKETMDLLISETGIEVEKNSKGADGKADESQLFEEVTFDRCFYIYGGPEHLEELEALSSHYALLFNRRKGKLSTEQKSVYDGMLKEVQHIFSLSTVLDGSGVESGKGKKKETEVDGSSDEIKDLHDSSVSKAADMAAGFTGALAGLAVNDIIHRTTGRLESLHSEGVHRLSEMCCSAVSQLLMLGKSIISGDSKDQDEDADADVLNIDWPEDSVEKAKIIRSKAQLMTGYVEAVSNSFITGISDVAESYVAAIKGASGESHEALSQTSIQERANAFSDQLRVDQTTAVGKIQDGLQCLSYLVVSRSIPVV